jgi:hypothetical protein
MNELVNSSNAFLWPLESVINALAFSPLYFLTFNQLHEDSFYLKHNCCSAIIVTVNWYSFIVICDFCCWKTIRKVGNLFLWISDISIC